MDDHRRIRYQSKKGKLVDLTAKLVAAYVSNNAVRAADLPMLLNNVHAALSGAAIGNEETAIASPSPVPAVNPKKSITPDYIICLEDGKKFKSLKRHLKTSFDLTPEEYRKKWNFIRPIRWSRRITPRVAPALPGPWGSVENREGRVSQRSVRSRWGNQKARSGLILAPELVQIVDDLSVRSCDLAKHRPCVSPDPANRLPWPSHAPGYR